MAHTTFITIKMELLVNSKLPLTTTTTTTTTVDGSSQLRRHTANSRAVNADLHDPRDHRRRRHDSLPLVRAPDRASLRVVVGFAQPGGTSLPRLARGPSRALNAAANVWSVSCSCDTPGAGAAGHNRYSCSDGTEGYCTSDDECYATLAFAKGDWQSGCRKALRKL